MKTIKIFSSFFVIIFILVYLGCDDSGSGDGTLTGTATASSQPAETGNFYVYLDLDDDITNGYTKRIVATYTLPFNPTSFEIDTSDVSDGTYYLSAAIDFGVGNIDPDDPSRWEYRGWVGSNTYLQDKDPSVSDLNGDYDITMYGIP